MISRRAYRTCLLTFGLRRRNRTSLHAFTPGVLKSWVVITSALLEPRPALPTATGCAFDFTTLGTPYEGMIYVLTITFGLLPTTNVVLSMGI